MSAILIKIGVEVLASVLVGLIVTLARRAFHAA